MRKRPLSSKNGAPSSTLTAPTCIGYSSCSRCRKLASSPDNRSYRVIVRWYELISVRSTAMPLTPTTVWTISPELVLALDAQLGLPVDSYLNGSQTWLVGDEEAGGNAVGVRGPTRFL